MAALKGLVGDLAVEIIFDFSLLGEGAGTFEVKYELQLSTTIRRLIDLRESVGFDFTVLMNLDLPSGILALHRDVPSCSCFSEVIVTLSECLVLISGRQGLA